MNIFLLIGSFFTAMNITFQPERAGIILYRDNQYLLVQNRNTSKWSFTKGHSEPFDVNLLETATREVKEESGYLESEHYTIRAGPYEYGRSMYWYGEVYTTAPHPTLKKDEHFGIGWFTRPEIQLLRTNKDIRVWLKNETRTTKQ